MIHEDRVPAPFWGIVGLIMAMVVLYALTLAQQEKNESYQHCINRVVGEAQLGMRGTGTIYRVAEHLCKEKPREVF